MEDFHCIKQALGKKYNLSYFSIFDGHGGKDVAENLSINLHHYLIKEINAINFGKNDEENINNILESIKIAFMKIDQEILSNNNFVNDVGSTATLIFIYYNDLNNSNINNDDTNDMNNIERTLICANIGDSSGFLINKLNIKQITKQHKCEDLNEVQRIKDKGGIVFQGRIFGKLILTRTFGDREMKKYGVVPTPSFFVKKIEKDDFFVVIASDGIWDVLNEDELFKMGNEKELGSETFSKKIMNIAKERDTRDNSSCIVIKLNKNI
jgi:serine/threonine protein phosphatase PrpC